MLKEDVSIARSSKDGADFTLFVLTLDINKGRDENNCKFPISDKGGAMARIAGVDLPNEKRIEAALPYIFGIGPLLAKKIIANCNLDPNIRTKNLTEEEVSKLTKEIAKYKIEGDLRREIQSNIKRLQEISSYRGTRHLKNLPARGQRTRTNARTKRGKRVTIGTVRKDVFSRTGKTPITSGATSQTK